MNHIQEPPNGVGLSWPSLTQGELTLAAIRYDGAAAVFGRKPEARWLILVEPEPHHDWITWQEVEEWMAREELALEKATRLVDLAGRRLVILPEDPAEQESMLAGLLADVQAQRGGDHG